MRCRLTIFRLVASAGCRSAATRCGSWLAAWCRLAATTLRSTFLLELGEEAFFARINWDVNALQTLYRNAFFRSDELLLGATALIGNACSRDSAAFFLNVNQNELLARLGTWIRRAATAILSGTYHWKTHGGAHDGGEKELEHENLFFVLKRSDNTLGH